MRASCNPGGSRSPRRSSGSRRCAGRSASRDDSGARVGSKRSGSPTSPSSPGAPPLPAASPARSCAHSSKVSSRRFIFRSASANMFRSPPEKSARPSRNAENRPTSSTPIALRAFRSRVVRVRRTDELRRGQTPRTGQIVDLVVRLIPHPRPIHPPQHIASAVPARQADVLPDCERHRSPRAVNLSGELHAGGRRTDDERTPVGQLGRIVIVEWGDLLDRRRHRRLKRRNARQIARAAREHDAPAADIAVGRRDVIPVVRACHRRDVRIGANRRARHRGEPRDELDHLGHRHVAVRIRAVVAVAGQATLPVGREQPQRLPALAPPGVRYVPTLEQDVVDRALR